MSDQSLSQRLAKGETASIGIISDTNDTMAIARLVCSLLNSSEGGAVYVGVDDGGHPTASEVTPEQRRSLEAALQSEISPPALYSVSIDRVKSSAVLTIDVPPGSDRPYVVEGAVWVREDGNTKPAASSDIRAMFAGTDQAELRWERRISTGMTESDLDTSLVRRIRERAEGAGRLVLIDAETELEMLGELSYWRPKGFTQACDVVFAKAPGRRLPQARVQLLQFKTDKTADTYEDYRWYEGSAIDIVEQVFTALQPFKKTRALFTEGSLEREEQPAYSDFPLREAIVNALAHRDYEAVSGGAKVSVYPDRIEFWNSGKLPPELTVKDLLRKHQSYPINPDIAHAFYLNGFMERTGRGTARIVESCKQIGAPPPVWSADKGGVTLVIYAALPSGKEIIERLSDRQRAYLKAVQPGETLTAVEYAERFAKDITRRQAGRELTELETYRFVRKEGQSVATIYRRL